jgi:hypothetical protein
MISGSLLSIVIALAQESAPVLVLESGDGNLERMATSELPLADPRSRSAWFVRPVGFPSASSVADGGDPVELTLAGGDRLRGRVASALGERLELAIGSAARLSLSIDSIARLDFLEHAPPGPQSALDPAQTGDRLWRRTGASLDRLDGTLLGFEAAGVHFEARSGGERFERHVPWAEVVALCTEVLDGSVGEARSDGVPVVLDLEDGSRFRAALVELGQAGAEIELASTRLVIPYADLAELVVADGRIAFVGELELLREEGRGTPFGDELGMAFTHRADRAVMGGALVAGGERHARGIGCHAPSQLVFRLPEGAQLLRGAVAVDDSVLRNDEHARGEVVFRVHVGGALAWESPHLRGGDAPVPLPPIDLSKAGAGRELVLEVDALGDFRGDRGDWLRLLVVRGN